ncbi:MAG: mechanosensitive ion channel family protein [Bacteroidia bacterium]
MKEFLSQTVYHNTVENWLYSIGLLVAGVVLSKVIYWLLKSVAKKITSKTETTLDDILIDVIEKPVLYAIVVGGAFLGFKRLHFTDDVDNIISTAFTIVFILNITWLAAKVVDAIITELIIPIAEKENSLDDHIIPVIRKGVAGALWTLGIVVALDNAGFNIMALVTGLGIGGLALALAAQDTVKNIFGGIIIFIDKPFKIGERVKVGGFDGFIEKVGIRSTRLRTLENRIVTIPNSKFSESEIENVTAEPTRRVVVNLSLTYNTTPEKMKQAMTILKDIVDKNQHLITSEHTISFNTYGDYSLGILFIYFIRRQDDIFTAQSQINLEILTRFNENGLSFAFPTQTIYKKELL